MGTATSYTNWIDVALWIWFALTAVSTAYVAWDLFTHTPEMKVMKWGWILVTPYTGVIGLIVYWFSCREPAPYTHEKFIAPLWKQSVGSTIHCMAGDATGIIVAARMRWIIDDCGALFVRDTVIKMNTHLTHCPSEH